MQQQRRELVTNFGAVGAFGAAALAFGQAPRKAFASDSGSAGSPDHIGGPYVDLRTGAGNQIGYARMQGDLDESKQRIGWFKGYVMGVRPGEKIRDLFGFAGFGASRLERQEDGGLARVLREVGYYTDLRSGEDLEQVHSRALLDYTEKHYPKYLHAPETYHPDTPSLSSLERYSDERTPAPPKQGG